MTGADRRAQALGYPELRLMEHAGTAVAAAVRALATDLGRWGTGPIVDPVRSGQQRRRRVRGGSPAGARRGVGDRGRRRRRGAPGGASAARNWDRIARDSGIVKVQLPVARDVAMFGLGVEKAAVIVDALLGTGVRGALREPIRSAVELVGRARAAGVPVVAVDTPTAVDLSSGEPSDPAVLADLTVTFHRPKTGLLTRRGAAHAGQDPGRPDRDPGRRPIVAEPRRVGSQPGWREVLIVAGAAVAVVLGAAILTSILPVGAQEIVFHTPLAIVVLIARDRLAAVAHLAPAAGPARAMIETPSAAPITSSTPLERRQADLDAAHPRDVGRRHRRWRDRRRRSAARRRLARDARGPRRAGRHRRRHIVALVAADPRRSSLPRAVPLRARARGPRRAVAPPGSWRRTL